MDRFVIRNKKCSNNSSSDPPVESVSSASEFQNFTLSSTNTPTPSSSNLTSSTEDGKIKENENLRKNKKEQNFQVKWKEKYMWVIEKDNKAFCKYCHIKLPNNKHHLIRHESSNRHQRVVSIFKKQPKIEKHTNEFQAKDKKLKTAELRILMFILQYNLPFSLITPLIQLIKCVATDSKIVKDIEMGKTKATEVTKTILLEEANSTLANILRKQKFSLIVDETTDISSSKCLILVARYFDTNLSKVKDRFLSLIQLASSDAQNIYKCICTCLAQIQVPFKNCIGFASDNASVMTGMKGGLKALLLKDNENMFTLGCACHSLHLSSSAAAKLIPEDVEILARNIYLYFSHSPKRHEELKQFQEHFNVDTHKILKVSSTRWLSLEKVVCRILEQWQALEHYFLYTIFESKNHSNADLAKKIQSQINNQNKFYFYFLAYILNTTNKINLEFQSESLRVHVLLPLVKSYYKTILSNFIKTEFLQDDKINQIDFENIKYFKEIKDIYTGGKAELFIKTANFQEKEISEMKKCCRQYYIALCKQISRRFDFNDKVLNAVQGINPSCLAESATSLLSAIPSLVNENEIEELDFEWRLVKNQVMVPKTLDIEDFWTSIFKMKNAVNEEMFPKLNQFIPAFLCLPHSSAAAERMFSQLTLIKDRKRNSLDISTINEIMASKELINENDAVKWIPSKTLLETYKK